jgi:hypothetical protein
MADKRFPSPKEVEVYHTNSDKDGSPTSIHHSLGNGPNQSSPGDHTHDGGSSKQLLDGTSITGSRAGGAALISVINALKQLGATDATTP